MLLMHMINNAQDCSEHVLIIVFHLRLDQLVPSEIWGYIIWGEVNHFGKGCSAHPLTGSMAGIRIQESEEMSWWAAFKFFNRGFNPDLTWVQLSGFASMIVRIPTRNPPPPFEGITHGVAGQTIGSHITYEAIQSLSLSAWVPHHLWGYPELGLSTHGCFHFNS